MKLVLTGGPSGGKTTLAMAIKKEFSTSVHIIPEAASILFQGGWPRRKNVLGVQHQQKAIYYVQREMEALLYEENAGRLMICDRGSLDGMAYWPGPGPGADFLKSVGTTLESEIARYHWVIHLDTAPEDSYDGTNPLRNEEFEEAWSLNQRIKDAWSHHPQRIVIANHKGGHFLDKLRRALNVVEMIIDKKSFAEVLEAADRDLKS